LKRRKHGGGGGHGGHGDGAQVEGAPFWMITYADMVTLMFAFFVMLTTMANPDSPKARAAIRSIAASLGVLDGHGLLPGKPIDADQLTDVPEGSTNPQPNLLQALYEQLSRYSSNDFIQVGRTDTGLRVVLGEALLFRPGSALLQPGAFPFLNDIAAGIARSGVTVDVQGHADDTDPGDGWRSNWDLAAARSVTVLQYLQARSKAPAGRFRAVSHGATRPLEANDTDARRARNRRVEIHMTVTTARDDHFFDEPRWTALPPRQAPSGVLRDEPAPTHR